MLYWTGLIVGVGLAILGGWIVMTKQLKFRWYELLIGAVGLISVFAAVQHYFSSIREWEATSAWLGAVVFGLLGLIMLGVVFQLVRRHNRAR
ncbi:MULTISPECIES: hypothetical protein [Dehalococcoides]|jgi:heme/copper-type cytochrome/quinol oxidase subunit 4|uniref:Reductive dehalogenase anchoring protein n=2 Tax=Dehalococcoides mccartyi TaxID=61435 RepID=A0A916NW12_DEHMC|nr:MULTISPECIES: hypothetical protein [Dehalococcoides]AGG06965.1 putative reductive dehalogenase anchoring protein [Dehalococcoides mccartyi DCMB5]AIZ97096.1 putative anchoring protein KB1rdhB19 [Dehalococcoides mccartyi]BAS32405.1 reductive dehalogenase anchoring protein [Dehalococcoides mccartyi IBARAKI]CAI83518.1 putative reductive dehalogenase anchoring protein [Dehalococcoides mccartyi CBDB1]